MLQKLASAAANYERRRDRCGRHRIARWRARLDAAFQRGLATAAHSSHHGDLGHPRFRLCLVDPLVVDVIPGEDGDEGLVSLGGIWS